MSKIIFENNKIVVSGNCSLDEVYEIVDFYTGTQEVHVRKIADNTHHFIDKKKLRVEENLILRYAIVKNTELNGSSTLEDYNCSHVCLEALEYIRNNGIHKNENDDEVVNFSYDEDNEITFGVDVEVWHNNRHLGFGVIEHTPVVLNKAR